MVTLLNPFADDEVVGVITPDRADDVIEAGRAAGFDVELITDPNKISVDGQSDDDSIFDSIVRAFQEGEEKDTLRRFERRLSKGDCVVRLVSVGDRVEEAGRLLAEHHAEIVWHFGSWTYTPLHST